MNCEQKLRKHMAFFHEYSIIPHKIQHKTPYNGVVYYAVCGQGTILSKKTCFCRQAWGIEPNHKHINKWKSLQSHINFVSLYRIKDMKKTVARK